jgi:hypothetical protein
MLELLRMMITAISKADFKCDVESVVFFSIVGVGSVLLFLAIGVVVMVIFLMDGCRLLTFEADGDGLDASKTSNADFLDDVDLVSSLFFFGVV